MSEWSEQDFKTRITHRSAVLSKPLRQVLADAGMAHDTLEKIPSSGRRLDTLERLAKQLDWSLSEIMGHGMDRVTGPLLHQAVEAARRVVQRARGIEGIEDPEFFNLAALIYNMFTDRLRGGAEITPAYIDGVVDANAESWRRSR